MHRPNKLTEKFVSTITEPGRYGAGRGGFGLSLLVKPTADSGLSKSWAQRITIAGRRTNIGIGAWPIVTLARARAKALANLRAVDQGRDPRDRSGGVPTFAAAAERVIALHAETWRDGGKTANQWRASLRDYVIPRLGKRPVDKISTADVLAVLTHNGFWNEKRETARRCRQRISAICRWAIAEGHRSDDPAGDALRAALPKNGNHRKHHAALPYDRVSGALATIQGSGAWWATKAAFEFLVLTAARSGEVRGARWEEFDLDAAVWTVPASRMKAKRDHRVPLSARALAVLAEARECSDGAPDSLVFPAQRGGMLSDMTMSKLLKERNIEAVPHGFRSSFRQWAAERTNFPREVCEQALAHVNKDKIEAAYQRGDLFDKRRQLMDMWARYLDTSSASVVAIR